MALTVDFVAAVRRQGSISAQVSDADILASGDMEIQGTFLSMLRRAGSEYGVRRLVVPVLNGRAAIPDRSQVSGLRLVQYQLGNQRWSLNQVLPEDDLGLSPSATPSGFYLDAGSICVVPTLSGGNLLVRYYQRPSSMILSSTIASTSQITAVVEGPTTTTVTFNAGTTVASGDVISAGPSHHVVIPGLLTGTGSAAYANTIYDTADSERPVPLGGANRTITVGDWVAINGRTPFVPLPEELFAALVHRTAGVVLQALGYLPESSAQLAVADEAATLAMELLTPRGDGSPIAVTSGISRSLGQGIRGRGGWW